MSLCVNLYWGGKIVQCGLSVGYDPPYSNGSIVLSGSVSYDVLVDLVCERIGINKNEQNVVLIWRRSVNLGYGYSYIAARLDQFCMQMMFDEACTSRLIELYVEISPNYQQQSQPTVTYDVGFMGEQCQPYDIGTSRGEQYRSSQLDTGGMNLGENRSHMLDVDEDVDEDDDIPCGGPDLRSPPSPEESEGEESMSDESDPDLSDEEVLEAPRPYAPIVSREQPIPQFVHRGLEYFRSLPTYSYQSSYYDGSEEGSWYWDEEKPTHIGLGTKFDGKLHLKTAITLWHLNHTRQYRVVESKGKRWHAICKEAKEAEASSETKHTDNSNTNIIFHTQIR